MTSGFLGWFSLSGSVAAWLALIYLVVTVVWGSPELKAVKAHLNSMDKHLDRMDKNFNRMYTLIRQLINKIPGGKGVPVYKGGLRI